MPEKAPTTADFSLLSSLPPPTLEIVTDKIPHPPEKCQLKPTTQSGKKRFPSMGGALSFSGTALSIRRIFEHAHTFGEVFTKRSFPYEMLGDLYVVHNQQT